MAKPAKKKANVKKKLPPTGLSAAMSAAANWRWRSMTRKQKKDQMKAAWAGRDRHFAERKAKKTAPAEGAEAAV